MKRDFIEFPGSWQVWFPVLGLMVRNQPEEFLVSPILGRFETTSGLHHSHLDQDQSREKAFLCSLMLHPETS